MHKRYLTASLAGLAVVASALLSAGMSAGAASAATSNGCPAANAVGNFQAASNVSASFANGSGADKTATTYTFSSLANENPSGGGPGLIKYCVYPSAPQNTAAVDHALVGANKAHWVAATGSGNFAFARPAGDPSNIPLDGTHGITMGTATWSNGFPASQSILLHINDPTVCSGLYGSGTLTCFVKPSTGPVCNHGDSNVAYNAMPFDVANCINPATGFEANSASEMGNEANLASGTGRNLSQLKVDFQSFGCGASGHWYSATDPCVTTSANPSFTLPVTANIYAVGNGGQPGALLATDTETQTIPFRPSADPSCPAVGSSTTPKVAWFNPLSGQCQNSIGTVLSFSNWTFTGSSTLPDQAIWTVAFSTTHYGASPFTESAACFATDAGCGYDSLNVGDATHPNAPYAGTQTDTDGAYLSSTWAGAYNDGGAGGTGSLRLDPTGWGAYLPLGEIITIR
jgi:hypothetical protein